jgi:poly(3-hydroxybutyrate) depolymerase
MKKNLLVLLALMPMLAMAQRQTIKTISIDTDNDPTTNTTKRYWEYLPPGYAASTGKKYTVVIFLHGQGEQGDTEAEMDSIKNLKGTPPNDAETVDLPFILLSPQLPKLHGGWYRTYVRAMVNRAISHYNSDPENIYIVGVSLGGGGALLHGADPEWDQDVAGIVSVCASSSDVNDACNVATDSIRVWAFHGTEDKIKFTVTTSMINAINDCSPKVAPKLTLYQGAGHNIWGRAFNKTNAEELPNVYQWIMKGNKRTPVADAGEDRTVSLSANPVSITGSGTDTDGTIQRYKWIQFSGPNTATLSGVDTATLEVSNMVAGDYKFHLQVTDDLNWPSTPDEITVHVVANQAPVANAGADKNVNRSSGIYSTTLSGSATDADGTIVSYAWTKIAGGQATLTNANTQTLSLSDMLPGTYVFRLTATDNQGATDDDDVTVVANNPPTANAGADQRITLPVNSIQLTGSGTDTDGTIASYKWEQYSGPTATMSGTTTTVLSLTNLAGGIYMFRLSVKDDKNATSNNDYVTLVVNQPPVANAGADQSFRLPANSVTLSGSGTDPDGTLIRTYAWTQVSGGAATLTGANTATLSVSNMVEGSYTFRLVVTDSYWETSAGDDVIVTVLPATQPPVANAGADKIINPSSGNYSTTLNGSASDPDGTIVSYAWTTVSGGPATLTNANTPTVSLSNLTAGTYVFRLTATDNDGVTGYDDVTVIANAVPVADAGADQRITLPVNSIQLQGSGSDTDGTISSYTWEQYSGPTATMSGTTTPTLTLSNLAAGIYMFRLFVRDNNLAKSSNNYVTLVVNEPPVANAGADQSVTLPTNSLTLTGSGYDPDGTLIRTYAWTKVSGGQATLSNANTATLSVSNMVQGSYTFSLVVTDGYWEQSVGDEVMVTVLPLPAGRIAVSSITEEETGKPTSLEDLEKEGTCEKCVVTIYNMQGKILYAGQYDADILESVIRHTDFYIYNLRSGSKKVGSGKVMRRK